MPTSCVSATASHTPCGSSGFPNDANRWVERVRLLWESFRASRHRTYAYTTRPLAALGALLGGARGVVLEFHIDIKPRHDRLAFSLARRSKRLHVVCISRRLAELIAEQTGYDESRIIVEHNGATFPIHHDYRADSAAGRRVRATYVGTFAPAAGSRPSSRSPAARRASTSWSSAERRQPGALPDNVTVAGTGSPLRRPRVARAGRHPADAVHQGTRCSPMAAAARPSTARRSR